MRPLRLGISTCPNDTFAFHGLLHGHVDLGGIEVEVSYLDVEELNHGMAAGRFDIAKVSFHAALSMAEDCWVLPSGSALGFGVGPLVLARDEQGAQPNEKARVLCPGPWTTATLLWKLFHPGQGELIQMVFSDILPALKQGRGELGVCIHEARFVWREQNLVRVEDLGETWEARTGCPLPLGGIVARRSLEPGLLSRFQRSLFASIEWGEEHREACLPAMRAQAQEQSDEVLWAHVDLYVNEWTRELGDEGRRALATLARLANESGVLRGEARLEVFETS